MSMIKLHGHFLARLLTAFEGAYPSKADEINARLGTTSEWDWLTGNLPPPSFWARSARRLVTAHPAFFIVPYQDDNTEPSDFGITLTFRIWIIDQDQGGNEERLVDRMMEHQIAVNEIGAGIRFNDVHEVDIDEGDFTQTFQTEKWSKMGWTTILALGVIEPQRYPGAAGLY
jgi:hypothetical protein